MEVEDLSDLDGALMSTNKYAEQIRAHKLAQHTSALNGALECGADAVERIGNALQCIGFFSEWGNDPSQHRVMLTRVWRILVGAPMTEEEIRAVEQAPATTILATDRVRPVCPPTKRIPVIINGKTVTFTDRYIAYETFLVYTNFKTTQTPTMLWSTPEGSGTLRPGYELLVTPNLVINVMEMSQA